MNRHPSRLGRTVTIEQMSRDPHPLLHRLRAEEPVSWIPALEAWLVTRHDQCAEVMLDPTTYTVDDPRFSTQQVIGPSMLSLDGFDHRRHRVPFAEPFRAGKVRELEDFTRERARLLVDVLADTGSGDLREGLAGPLAAEVMTHVLDLSDAGVEDILGWYERIVEAVHVVTAGGNVPGSGLTAFAELKHSVVTSSATSELLQTVSETGELSVDEIVSNVAVLLFGGIVTTESSIAIALHYLLGDRALVDRLVSDRSLVRQFVEETFRIEPSAAAVDRYATSRVNLGDATIEAGDLVRVSLSGANRDPAVFAQPDHLDIRRPGLGQALTFARGPHACLGIHLARLETVAAVEAVLDRLPVIDGADLDDITGLVFRAPETLTVSWR